MENKALNVSLPLICGYLLAPAVPGAAAQVFPAGALRPVPAAEGLSASETGRSGGCGSLYQFIQRKRLWRQVRLSGALGTGSGWAASASRFGRRGGGVGVGSLARERNEHGPGVETASGGCLIASSLPGSDAAAPPEPRSALGLDILADAVYSSVPAAEQSVDWRRGGGWW